MSGSVFARILSDHLLTVSTLFVKTPSLSRATMRTAFEADKIFINVGASAFRPSGFEAVGYFTNSSMMDVDFLPEHLLVVGGSYIGLEFRCIGGSEAALPSWKGAPG